ncbi:MAG: peptidoglycan binding protein CsiV [Gammaproteobacteria bacterium]|nr:peptidoglycan binding protein CsiV [Gammaproteobacteria bacterium]
MPRFVLAGLLGLCCLAPVAPTLHAQTQTSGAAPPPAATAPVAATRWEAVEVLVFRSVIPSAGQQEAWPAQVPAPPIQDAIYPPNVDSGTYSALMHHGPLIANAALRLRGSSGYAVVKILGWRQPASPSRTVSFAPLPATAAGNASVRSTPYALTRRQSGVQIQGTARLLTPGDRSYVILHLRLCQPTPAGLKIWLPPAATAPSMARASIGVPSAVTQTPPFPTRAYTLGRQCFALDQRHRIYPGKLTYFDNPIFGALVSVRAIKPPAD